MTGLTCMIWGFIQLHIFPNRINPLDNPSVYYLLLFIDLKQCSQQHFRHIIYRLMPEIGSINMNGSRTFSIFSLDEEQE